jgi:Trk-type K+ transport system membrane component
VTVPELPSDVSAVKPANGASQVKPVGNSVPLTVAAQNVVDAVHAETHKQTQVLTEAINPLGIPSLAWWVSQLGMIGVMAFILLYLVLFDRPQQQAHFDAQLQGIRDENTRHNDEAVKAVQANTMAVSELKTLIQLQLKLKPAQDEESAENEK